MLLFLTVRPSSPTNDEASGKDFKFVLIEKENAPVKKETERLIMTKDTGKQFMSPAPPSTSGNSTTALILLLLILLTRLHFPTASTTFIATDLTTTKDVYLLTIYV